MTDKHDRLNISTLPSGYKAKISSKAKELGINQGELIAKMFDTFEKMEQLEAGQNGQVVIGEIEINNFGFKETSDIKQVKDALVNSGLTLQDLAREGLLWRSRYINGIAKKQSEFEKMEEEGTLNKTTVKGSADYKIEKAIQAIIEHNDKQTERNNKVYISKGMVFKLTGSNRQTISKFFDNHKYIEEHNNKHELEEADNRKGKGVDFKELIGIDS
ncbi:MAG: hypothetical protein QNJ54_22310 [Prochloraceae cyanobacterium]|nr:hypothetical protein [Prochloraceae cyanobacterium]